MSRRLEVFLSSTKTDLHAHRNSIAKHLAETGYFAAGMELFPAGNRSIWKTITSVIEKCSVYVLVVGPRYGYVPSPKEIDSTEENKLSYTDLEFEYAKQIATADPSRLLIVPLVWNGALPEQFLHEKTGNQIDIESDEQDRREEFVTKLKNTPNLHVKEWEKPADLITALSASLGKYASGLLGGWVPADGNSQQAHIDRLEKKVSKLQADYDGLEMQMATGDDPMPITLIVYRQNRQVDTTTIRPSSTQLLQLTIDMLEQNHEASAGQLGKRWADTFIDNVPPHFAEARNAPYSETQFQLEDVRKILNTFVSQGFLEREGLWYVATKPGRATAERCNVVKKAE